MQPSESRSRIVTWLEHPRARGVVIAFALLLALPSPTLGFFSDDYVYVAVLEHRLARTIPWFPSMHRTAHRRHSAARAWGGAWRRARA